MIDTAPLVAAANSRDRAHRFSAALIAGLGRDLLLPLPVLVEADHLIRERLGAYAARRLLAAAASGTYAMRTLTAGLLRRAVELDERYSDLDLGLTDASVMAIAEQQELPILTFDFKDFRATESASGPWPLLVSEAQLEAALERG